MTLKLNRGANTTVDTDTFLRKICIQNERCPLCRSDGKTVLREQQKNRYSEDFARLFDVPEELLLRAFVDYRCKNCSVVYKNWWFRPEIYYSALQESVPIHPRGWDSVSGDFNEKQFNDHVAKLAEGIRNKDQRNIGRLSRTVESFIDNISLPSNIQPEIRSLVQKAKLIPFDSLSEEDERFLTQEISILITQPKPFGRFSGYGGEVLGDFISKLTPPLRTYGEIGCPLWGMMHQYASNPAIQKFHLRDEKMAFWGATCAKGAITCVALSTARFGINQTSLTALRKTSQNLDLLTVIHYLDHLADPATFLREAFEVTRSLLIICHGENDQNTGAIQHNLVFNLSSLRALSPLLGCSVEGVLESSNEVPHGELIVLLKRQPR